MYGTDVRVGVTPCKDCKDRHDLCHSSCEEYIKWKQRHDEVKDLDYKWKKEQGRMYEYEVGRLAKARGRRMKES